jgi:hypothetical protein
MPSLLDPSLLRGQQPGDDPTGIQTLLAGIGSALSGGVAAPNDPNTSMAAILAAGNALANAGAPTLGPPPTTAQAILGALGGARNAAVQTGILPYMQERAQQQLESQNLDYQVKLFNFNRRINQMHLLQQGIGADASGAAPAAPAVPGAPGAAPPQPSGDIAALPDVQALPDQTRVAVIQAMMAARMTPDEAAQYARMLMAESGGLHIDPKTNQVKTSSKGASGVAQVMPQTFIDMAQAHDDVTGSVADLVPNLLAGAHFFHDQVTANNGDLRNAAIAYNFGPGNLTDYLAGKKALPAETTDYLAKVRPGGVQVADASGRVVGQPGAPAPPGASTGADALVPVLGMPGLQVPRSVELAARTAGLSAEDPYAGYSAVIKDYVEKRALAPHYLQAGPPGTQIDVTSNQRVASPPGTETLDAPTPAERQKLFPNVPAWQDILVKRTPDGRIVGHELPNMGEEPIKPISDEQAQKPAEQGGAGASYRTGTAYGVGTRSGLVKPIQIERGAGPPLPGDGSGATVMTPGQQQALDFLSSQAQRDQRITNFQLQLGYVGRIANVAADPTRTATDDIAALAAFEKFNNPTAAVTQEGQNAVLTTGGPEQRVQTVISKLSGGRFLTPDVVQNIINTLNTESEGARAGFTVASNNLRRQAKARGVDPDLVTPDPDQMVREYQAEWKAAQDRLRTGKGVGGATVVPGAAPTERAGNLPPVPVPTPAQLGGMTAPGLAALVTDMKNNPTRYGPEHHQAIQAEIDRRKALAAPAAGGGG